MESTPSSRATYPWDIRAEPVGTEVLGFRLNGELPEDTVNSCIALYLTWNYWIPKKLYRFTFLDVDTLAHSLRWDLELPPGLPVLPGSEHFLVPIGIFDPTVRQVAVTMTDDAGREVPLLTGRETRNLVAQMSKRISTSTTSLPEQLLQQEVITGANQKRSKDTSTAGQGFLQVAIMTDPSRLRRSLTLEYQTGYEVSGDRPDFELKKEAFAKMFPELDLVDEVNSGRNPSPFKLSSSRHAIVWPVSGFRDAERSRIECEAPPELEIESVAGFCLPPEEARIDEQAETLEVPQPEAIEIAFCTPSLAYFTPGPDEGEQDQRLELRDNYAQIEIEKLHNLDATWRDQPAFITIFLRPRWEDLRDSFIGLGFGSVVLLLAAAFALLGSLFVDPKLLPVRVNKTPLAAVVAFTASIATSILIRPDSNEMAGLLLRPIRLRLAALGLLPVLAAVTIAIPVEAWINGVILLVLAGVEFGYTVYCQKRIPSSDEVREFEEPGEAADELKAVPLSLVRNAEMFRAYEGERRDDPVTDRGLMGAAQEFADSAGWKLERV